MNPFLNQESLGDWNDLKGATYHLSYALWRLVREADTEIAFYQGNDLLARPTVPPPSNISGEPSLGLHLLKAGEDEWIQLKARRKAWTCTDILSCKNLIVNFVNNALQSEQHGRLWRACLVTQGELPSNDLRKFVAQPSGHSTWSRHLRQIVADVQQCWRSNGSDFPDVLHIEELAFTVLGQLANLEPVYAAVLQAEVDQFLTNRYLSSALARQTRHKLLGAMFDDAGAGPSAARWYNGRWLDGVAGEPLKPDLIFDRDPVVACDQAIREVGGQLEPTWDPALFTKRIQLTAMLERFLVAPAPLFVLLGPSGSGKSWAISNWVSDALSGRVRLLFAGDELCSGTTQGLSRLVARHLRHLSAVPYSDEQILLRLRQEARLDGRGPFIVVLDDLMPQSSEDAGACRQGLKQLVRECSDTGAKLVITCQTHIWEFFRLGYDLLPTDMFTPDLDLAQSDPLRRCSFALADFTPEEQANAIGKRLSQAAAAGAIDQLRAPGYAVLRRPYFLERYLDEHHDHLNMRFLPLAPVDIDELLDKRVERQLDRAALSLSVHPDEMRTVLDDLRRVIWAHRDVQIGRIQVEECLARWFPDRASAALTILRRVGLLSTGAEVTFAEPLVADRIFARALRLKVNQGNDVMSELGLRDAGVVSALIRSLGVDDDPVTLSENLIAQNPEWLGPVTEGLAQCSSQDYRVLGCLTALARTESQRVVTQACDALGVLAARGSRSKRSRQSEQRAFEWVAQMYLSTSISERHLGGRALSATIRYEPQRVGRLLRLRLSRAARMPKFFSAEIDKRTQALEGSLSPLYFVDHRGALEVAKDTLARYADVEKEAVARTVNTVPEGSREDDGEPPTDYDLAVNTVRGLIALQDDAELDRVLADLKSTHWLARYHAACALRSATFTDPARVQHALCESIRCETEARVLNRLLWAVFPLRERAPETLLTVFRESLASQWDPNQFAAGQALAMLGDLAAIRPREVAALVPKHLNQFPPEARAWLSEGWTYAWWCCAEALPDLGEAREQLQSLAEPNLGEIPDLYRIFSLRGALLAQFALVSLSGVASVNELTEVQCLYPYTSAGLLYLYTSTFARQHAAQFVVAAGFGRLRDLALACLLEETRVTGDPRIRLLRDGRGRCAGLCLEILIAFATQHAQPVAILRELPQHWHRFAAARQMLASGRREAEVVDYAEELCAKPIMGLDMQALGERDLCLKQLATLRPDPRAALTELLTQTRRLMWGSKDRARAQAEFADEHPDQLLALLDDAVQSPRDLPTLYRWKDATNSWRGVLLLRHYARMFDPRAMDVVEARELCEQVLTAIHALPSSSHRQDYESVYAAIRGALGSNIGDAPILAGVTLCAPASPIRRSHSIALEILTGSSIERATFGGRRDLFDFFAARIGDAWWTGEGFTLDGDSTWMGSGETAYIFPAVRLAAVVMGARYGHRDPAAQFMSELARIRVATKGYEHECDFRIPSSVEMLERASEKLRALGLSADWHPLPWLMLSTVLLRLGQVDKAEGAVLQSLQCSYSAEARASALYNLACVYARSEREDDCQASLCEVAVLRSPNTEWLVWLRDDPDFEALRERPWFRHLSGE